MIGIFILGGIVIFALYYYTHKNKIMNITKIEKTVKVDNLMSNLLDDIDSGNATEEQVEELKSLMKKI